MRFHDRRHRLHEAHRPGQVDGDDLVPLLHGHTVEIGERDRLVVRGVVDENVEPTKLPGHVADHPLYGRAIGEVAGECRGVDLISRRKLAGNTLGLVAALGIHDGDMHVLLRQRVTDALPEPPVTARHEGNRTTEVHEFSPGYGCAVVWQRLPLSREWCVTWRGGTKAVVSRAAGPAQDGSVS